MLKFLDQNSMVLMVRYFELCAALSLISEHVYTTIAKRCLEIVLDSYFKLDLLTQYALLDFFYLFTRAPWTS